MNEKTRIFLNLLPYCLSNPMVEIAEKFIKDVLAYGYSKYKDLFLGIFVGLFIAWFYHKYIGNKALKDSYERLLKEKDETLKAYKHIIGGKLSEVEVGKLNKSFFNRVKSFFRKN